MYSSSLSLQSISSHDSEDEVVLTLEDDDNGDDDFVFLDMPCRRRNSCQSDTANAEQALPRVRETSETLNTDTADEAAAPEVAPPPTPSPPRPRKKGQTSPKAAVGNVAAAKETSSTSKQQQAQKKSRKRRSRKKANKAAKCCTTSASVDAETAEEMYKEASQFITSFLANPAAKQDSVCRLTLLQSLIVELGLASTALPTSLRSARAFLKSRVFINIREYLAHRGKDQAALQKLLYPSKKALVKDIKCKRKTVSRKWVKEHGLGVLLVECFHH